MHKAVKMSANFRSARLEVYRRLKKGFKEFSGMMNIHLEDTLLREMGVDPMEIDLEEETQRGGPYFLPLSQERMDSLDMRSELSLTFEEEDFRDPFDTSLEIYSTFDRHFNTFDVMRGTYKLHGTHWSRR